MIDLAVDMPDEMAREIVELQRKPPVLPVGKVVIMGENIRFLILGVFIDVKNRIAALEAQSKGQPFDEFELKRPLAWWVVVVPVDWLNPHIMVGSPQSIRVDAFRYIV